MRKLSILLIICLGFATRFLGQNLVPNPSFEEYSQCPDSPADIDKSDGWTHGGSSDYFNSCDPTNTYSVPYNFGGYQQAASGNAYAGIVTYSSSSVNYRELISHNLFSSLSIGTKYYISFKVNLSLGSIADANCAGNKIGAMFSTMPYTGSEEIITNNPHMYSSEIITDSLNWSTVFGSFIADSIYNHIILGNFFDDDNTDTTCLYNTIYDMAYYFLDDICVSTDSLYTLNYHYVGVNEKNPSELIGIYSNLANDYFVIENYTGESLSFKIHNSLGQELLTQDNILPKDYKVNIESLSPGLYLIEIKAGNFVLKRNLLKP